MIRLVHFIHGLNTGGAETLVKNYALLLDKSKYDLTVVCLTRYGSPYEKILMDAGVRVIYISDVLSSKESTHYISKKQIRAERYFKTCHCLRQLKPDIVHYHLPIASYLVLAHLPRKCAVVHTVHSDPHRLWLNGRKDSTRDLRAVKLLLRRHNMYLIALHEKMYHELKEIFRTDRVLVLNNGIDLSPFRKQIDVETKRESVHIPKDAFVVTHVGRFNPVKNHSFLVQVFAEIKKRRADAFLLMIGRGETEPAVRGELERMGLSSAYTILHDRTDVPELLLASDAAVFPSVAEGLPVAAIEMQAAALPCVASDRVPHASEISDRIRFLSLDESPALWADSLLSLCEIQTPISYRNIEEWDIQTNVKQLEEIYEKVLADDRKQNG